MIEVIGVRFKEVGKIYYFSPKGETLDAGAGVIVETSRGVEFGEVVIGNRQVEEKEIVQPLKNIMRVADKNDESVLEKNKQKEKEIYQLFSKKITEHGLEMKPIDIEYTFDGSKILFYFTAESRVDFRDLVKDLASVYRTRIELRQIGVRDEAKMLGGLGICGRKFCCANFLGEFQPVSIKMAKEQSLSLNPTKISGTCGRLMCCLKYEQDCYEELLKITPKIGAYIETAEGRGVVEDANLLTGIIKVKLDKNKDAPAISASRSDVKIIRDSQIRLEKDEIAALKNLEDN
ncbi:MAG: stage 0 sporulation family protein [Eubacterium sp.]|jgi:cell fate regulator YaaT (PSP1 superfamily)|nr:stage 0 sporulation family protein [Eubacterium sp.]